MLSRQCKITRYCNICGKNWVGITGGFNPKKMDSLEDIQHYKEAKASMECPFCKEKEMRSENAEVETEEENLPYMLQAPRYTLDDVFLPEKSKLQVDEALAKINNFHKIYIEWGFKAVDPCGAGTVLNFFGKPGTGKTMTAEALAGTLGKKFISLGMSDVESKYMGETAKNIRAAFECAKKVDAVLFFDEADTLLGARLSNVTQGIDNEVNSLRSTLLIELEKFEGIVIFATNFEKNYDKAFVSRITHHIQFDLPDQEGLRKIWDKFLVPQIPLDGDRECILSKLADISLGLAGRDVRNCMRLALPKAIMHDNEDESVLKLEHLVSAIGEVRNHEKVGTEVSKSRESSRAALRAIGVKINKEETNNQG